jgi:hypothetical protein
MYLWELIQKAGSENVYYCDTDSLLVNAEGFTNLASEISESEIGKLKMVSRGMALSIFGPKDYVLDLQARRKGVSPHATVSASGEARQEFFRGLKTRMKSGDLSGVLVNEVIKHRRATYDKGRVGDDGRVTPWILPMDANQPVFGP